MEKTLEQLKAEATALGAEKADDAPKAEATDEVTKTSAPVTAADDEDDGLVITADEKVPVYDGPGYISDAPKGQPRQQGIRIGPMANKERIGAISKTMNSLDEDIREQYQRFMDITKGGTVIPQRADANEVVVLLDKVGMGTVTFTEEEQQRIERAKKIRLVQVEDQDLKAIKFTKVIDKPEDFTAVAKVFDKTLSPFIAIASGYIAKIGNLPSSEAIKLIQRPGTDTPVTILEKWSVIYNKIRSSSIEFKDFDDFISRTAFCDMDPAIHAVLGSSYPENDSVSFDCMTESCKSNPATKSFAVEYTNSSILRSDLISIEQAENIKKIVEAQYSVEAAEKVVSEISPLGSIERIAIDRDFIVDLYIPSVKQYVANLKSLDPSFYEVKENGQYAAMATNIHSVIVVDYDAESGEKNYTQITGFGNVIAMLQEFNEKQLTIITKLLEQFMDRFTFAYGIKEVICPVCKRNYGSFNLDLENVLFQKVQHRITTDYELKDLDK